MAERRLATEFDAAVDDLFSALGHSHPGMLDGTDNLQIAANAHNAERTTKQAASSPVPCTESEKVGDAIAPASSLAVHRAAEPSPSQTCSIPVGAPEQCSAQSTPQRSSSPAPQEPHAWRAAPSAPPEDVLAAARQAFMQEQRQVSKSKRALLNKPPDGSKSAKKAVPSMQAQQASPDVGKQRQVQAGQAAWQGNTCPPACANLLESLPETSHTEAQSVQTSITAPPAEYATPATHTTESPAGNPADPEPSACPLQSVQQANVDTTQVASSAGDSSAPQAGHEQSDCGQLDSCRAANALQQAPEQSGISASANNTLPARQGRMDNSSLQHGALSGSPSSATCSATSSQWSPDRSDASRSDEGVHLIHAPIANEQLMCSIVRCRAGLLTS